MDQKAMEELQAFSEALAEYWQTVSQAALYRQVEGALEIKIKLAGEEERRELEQIREEAKIFHEEKFSKAMRLIQTLSNSSEDSISESALEMIEKSLNGVTVMIPTMMAKYTHLIGLFLYDTEKAIQLGITLPEEIYTNEEDKNNA